MSDVAVLVIGMMNAYRHEDAQLLTPDVTDIVAPLAGLVSRARGRRAGQISSRRQRLTRTASTSSRCVTAGSTPVHWAIADECLN